MAENQGIRSSFRNQLYRTSSKVRTYEGLFSLNRRFDQVVLVLRKMGRLPTANKPAIEYAVTEIEEVRCEMNASFTEKLADRERFDEGRFWKRRMTFEKRWRDADDVYIDVQHREEERKRQGLPARIIVLPWSAANEEKLLAAKRERAENKRNRASSPKRASRREKK
jgi:hypothetical protein